MNELMVFEGNEVEVFEFKGRVLFNPKHIANILGIKNVRDNISNMSDKQVVKLTNSIVGETDFRKLHNTGENFLTESGVYKLIMRSNKPEAERFQDWVTDEVLPSIRNNGGYIANQENLTPEQIVANALIVAQNIIQEKDRLLEEQKPKVEFADKLLKTKENILIREFAKLLCDEGLNTGEKRLYKWLRDNKFLMKNNEPYQRYLDNNTFVVQTNVVNTIFGDKQTHTTKITPEGQLYLYRKYMESENK